MVERLAYSINSAAKALGLHRSTISAAIARGEIPAFRIGVRKLIWNTDLETFVRSHEPVVMRPKQTKAA